MKDKMSHEETWSTLYIVFWVLFLCALLAVCAVSYTPTYYYTYKPYQFAVPVPETISLDDRRDRTKSRHGRLEVVPEHFDREFP